MTRNRPGRYDRPVAAVRDALRRAAAGFALCLGFLHPAVAGAASESFLMGDQGVVQVWAGARAQVTIKAWDRPNVQFDTDDEAAQVTRRPITFGTPQTPLSVPIPLANIMVRDPVTGTPTRATLPPEEFPYASDFRAGVHDSVRIVAGDDTHVTVMVPSTTALLDTRIRGGAGILSIDDYHGGTLFVVSPGGRTRLNDVMSAAFVQMMNGGLEVIDSSFDRLRARGNTANFIFQHDRARQIELTTVSGSIVYDNGTFDPGSRASNRPAARSRSALPPARRSRRGRATAASSRCGTGARRWTSAATTTSTRPSPAAARSSTRSPDAATSTSMTARSRRAR